MRGRVIRAALPVVLVAVAGVGVAMAASASTRSSGGTVRAVESAKYGTVLVGPSGKTLYRYTPDKKGVNTCTPVPACAKYWSRLLVTGTAKPGSGVSAGLLGTIKQPKGLVQVTYAGFPLYYFVGDAKAGDMKGQGFDGTWYVVNPKGALVKHAVAASSGSPTTTSGSNWG
jgi:predicted lipoprotein with Yx(FWY)xxD motif